MRRILVLNFEYPPIGGGGANANQHLFDEFAKLGTVRVDLVTSTEGTERVIEHHSPSIRLIRLPVGKKDLHYWRETEIVRYIRRATRECRRLLTGSDRYELLHAIFGFPSGFVAYRLRKSIPYIVSLHGSDVPGFNKRFKWHYPLLRPVFRRIWRNAEAVTVVSSAHRQLARETEPDVDFRVIPNGVDTDHFEPGPETATGGKRILAVCRLIRRKNIHLLIDAMPAILSEHPDARLTILGQGDELENLRRQTVALGLEKSVTLTGRIPHEELPDRYRDADLYVLPSEWEGMPITLLEAMASGLPAVTTSTGGTKELIAGNGIVIPTGDRSAIEEAVKGLLRDREKRAAMGEASREIALGFGWEAVARTYLSLYEEVCTKKEGVPNLMEHSRKK